MLIDITDTVQLTHTAAEVDADIDGSVRGDIAQTKDDTWKAQARENIGAGTDSASETELLDLKMLGWTVPKDFAVQNYEENGVFHQRVGRVDLGTLSYTYNGTYAYFLSAINGRAYSNDINMYALSYTNIGDKSSADMETAPNMSIAPNNNNINFKLKNTAYSTAAELKTALKGTYLYYELATEITHPVDGYEVAEPPVLLWENASLASNFVSQTIPLDLTPYKFVLVTYKLAISSIGSSGGSVIIPVGDHAKVIGLYNNTLTNRNFDLRVNNQIVISNNALAATYGAADATDNRFNIPHKIYGIK